VYVSVIEATSALRFIVKPGTHRPLNASASGQVVLSHLPLAEADAYVASGPFERFTPGTIATTSALRKAVALARSRHWSMTVDGTVLGAVGIAAPWFDGSGAVGGAVNIAAPTARILHREAQCARAVLKAGEDISRVLGYAGRYPPEAR
jgi:DNA-binding IclR family transcriptional regulator